MTQTTQTVRKVSLVRIIVSTVLVYLASLSSLETILLGDAELASLADRLAVVKSEGAPSSVADSAISIGRSSVITSTTDGVTQFSEVS